MKPETLLQNVKMAIANRAAAITMSHPLIPLGGANRPIKPSTHLVSADSKGPKARIGRMGSNYRGYAMGDRYDKEGNVVLCAEVLSIQQAARLAKSSISRMLLAGELAAPHMIFDAAAYGYGPLTVLDMAHGVEDAYVRDTILDGIAFDETEIGAALFCANERKAAALYQYAPWSLVFGGWDSHRGRVGRKFARAVCSDIVAIDVQCVPVSGAKSDPLDLRAVPIEGTIRDWQLVSGKTRAKTDSKTNVKKVSKLADVGYGMIPPSLTELGGVVAREYQQFGAINLQLLRQYDVGNANQNRAAATTLALLSLLVLDQVVGCVGAIRSGCAFKPVAPQYTVVSRSEDVPLSSPSTDDILAAIELAAAEAKTEGMPWHAEPVTLIPDAKLASVLHERQRLLDEGVDAEPVEAE